LTATEPRVMYMVRFSRSILCTGWLPIIAEPAVQGSVLCCVQGPIQRSGPAVSSSGWQSRPSLQNNALAYMIILLPHH